MYVIRLSCLLFVFMLTACQSVPLAGQPAHQGARQAAEERTGRETRQSGANQSSANQSSANQAATGQVASGARQSSASQAAQQIGSNQGDSHWDDRQQVLEAIDQYVAKGRVSVTYADEIQQGDFRLEVEQESYLLRLSGPFGLGAIELAGDSQSVVMSSARHGHVQLAHPDQELSQYLGFPVPIDAIRYWILGMPQPNQSSDFAVDNEGQRLATLTQGGWKIQYRQYQRFKDHELPRKIDIERDDVRIRMLFRRWQVGQ